MQSKSIRKSLPRLATVVVLLFLLLLIPVNILIQLNTRHNAQMESTRQMFGQLKQAIQTNIKDIENEKQLFKNRCIRSADTVAYYVEYNQEAIHDINITKELANRLEIDEIHYFTPDGEIFAGTHPEYYGLKFDSGEQIGFFKPMLQDHTLKLCQDIMPNTGEGKEMQYAAVWMENGSGIVQIGMEPRHIQREIEEKSLQNIVDKMPFELNGYLHIIDKQTQRVVASTKEDLLGKIMYEDEQAYSNYKNTNLKQYHDKYKGAWFCVYTKVYEDYILVRSYRSADIFAEILKSTGLVLMYIVLGSVGVIAIIRWYIRAKLIKNLNVIIYELKKIGSGSIERIEVKTHISEFDELLMYINQMIQSTNSSWNKLVYLMDRGELPIGIFEKNIFYERIFVNERLKDILCLREQNVWSSERMAEQLEKIFVRLEKNVVDKANHVFAYEKDGIIKYLHMEKLIDDQSTVYYVTDMTSWWREFHEVKEQVEIDELTGLYNRRGFYEKVNQLFGAVQERGYAAVVMVDADNLKKINDCTGHYMGDKYLRLIAVSLKEAAGENGVCARLGGDEFVVFLYGFSKLEDLDDVVEHMKAERGRFFAKIQENISYTLQFSMGVAVYPTEGQDIHTLMRLADQSMYQEKKIRKSCRETYVNEMFQQQSIPQERK